MPAGRDDDALTWDGDDDPTLDVGAADDAKPEGTSGETASLPVGWSAVGKGSETVSTEPEPGPADSADASAEASGAASGAAEREPMGNVELISLGVLGGFALLYAVGWLIGGLRLQGELAYLVTDVMYQGALWLAVLAPLIWFTTVILLTIGARTWVRFAWLAAGVALLVPWPFIMVGAIGR